jgi:hypothetical protein
LFNFPLQESSGGLHHIANWVGPHHIANWVGPHHIGDGNGQLGMERVERVRVKIKKKKRKS